MLADFGWNILQSFAGYNLQELVENTCRNQLARLVDVIWHHILAEISYDHLQELVGACRRQMELLQRLVGNTPGVSLEYKQELVCTACRALLQILAGVSWHYVQALVGATCKNQLTLLEEVSQRGGPIRFLTPIFFIKQRILIQIDNLESDFEYCRIF